MSIGARHWTARAAGVAIAVVVAIAIGAEWVAPHDPHVASGRPFEPPSLSHWLGTNDVGQDLLTELIFGARRSLAVGLLTAMVAVGLGAAAGLAAGYIGGRFDTFLSRVVDLALVLPLLPLTILVAAYAGPSLGAIVVLLGLLSLGRPARVVRARTRALVRTDRIAAARALGAGHRRILATHLLPEVWPLAVTQFVLVAGSAVALESGLSFLGLGDPTTKSWGAMLHYAQTRNALLTGHWLWWVVPPGLMIAATVSSLAVLGLGRARS